MKKRNKPNTLVFAKNRILSEWQLSGAWAAFSAEIEGDAEQVTFRTRPGRSGDQRRLALSVVLFILSLLLLFGVRETNDVAASVVSKVFGIIMLVSAIGNACLSLRILEWRSQFGQLIRRSSVFGIPLGSTIYLAEDISHISRDNQTLNINLTGLGKVPIVKNIDDEALLDKLQQLLLDELNGQNNQV